jgi:hypothetical protein
MNSFSGKTPGSDLSKNRHRDPAGKKYLKDYIVNPDS